MTVEKLSLARLMSDGFLIERRSRASPGTLRKNDIVLRIYGSQSLSG